jgi:hypothetical protein
VKKNQEGSDVMVVDRSGEDDIMQDEDWIQLGASTIGMDIEAYMSVDQQLTTCGVLCKEEMCGVVGCGSCVEVGLGNGVDDDDEAESKPVPSFTEALHAFESVRCSGMLTTSPNETKRTSLILKGYYSVLKGKVLLNK